MTNSRTGRALWMVILLTAVSLATQGFAQDTPAPPAAAELWTASFPDEIEWQKLTDAGYLLVFSKAGLQGVNPETGAVAWIIADLEQISDDYVEIIAGTPYAILTKKIKTTGLHSLKGRVSEVAMLDVTSGQALWTSKELGISNSWGHFVYWPSNALLMYGQKEDSDDKIVVMADMITGKPIWTSATLFEKGPKLFSVQSGKNAERQSIAGNQPPVVLPDGNFLEFWSKAGLRKINAKTGDVIWTSPLEVEDVPALRSDYAPIQLSADGQIAYIPQETTVNAVKVSDGSVLWKKGPKLPSKIVQMEATAQGLVVRGAMKGSEKQKLVSGAFKTEATYTKPYLTVIDPATGKPKWKDTYEDAAGSSEFVIHNDRIVIYNGFVHNSLMAFNIADGSETILAKKIKLEGGKDPSFAASLELAGDYYLLKSDQDLVRFNAEGSEVYHNHHKAPGSALLKTIGKYASGISASTDVGGGTLSFNEKERVMKTNPVMSKRLNELDRAANFTTIATGLETLKGKKSPGLVKIDKTTGADVTCIVLGEKKPDFLHDGVEERLFFQKDDKTIVCYSF